MKFVSVIQHTQSEWLGAIEDHLEGRGIRFGYFRPFATGGKLPEFATLGDGLILLGGGPWGAASAHSRLPTLDAEVRLARACLMHERAIIGIGLGAQILSLAADGGALPRDFTLAVGEASRASADALGGFLPERFAHAVLMRDRPAPPAYADILAVDTCGAPALFKIGRNAFGFAGHPGLRRAMVEDTLMEFDAPVAGAEDGLAELSLRQSAIEDALVPIMAGLVSACDWMPA